MRVAAFVLMCLALADPAYAYMGPGAGLAFIGSLVALIAALGIGALGLIWYPLKRLIHLRQGTETEDKDAS
ncbi:hypothetical protein GCM10023264_19930 [Sphingomonas daechungensis]|uniref:Uncharacterized protein n=1 Tax=Sphingomonas daechungensis TaxID=1176646 RepID=A0ABX6T876_9SPHN|nr:hypothetical protein [Sphingomonas daechungensis]QNP43878.1 hypothetical protein H9L15_04395 [Sphingomonas daechungensis]